MLRRSLNSKTGNKDGIEREPFGEQPRSVAFERRTIEDADVDFVRPLGTGLAIGKLERNVVMRHEHLSEKTAILGV